MTIQRYSPGDITVGEKCVLVPYVSGEIVMYADHARVVQDLQARIDALELETRYSGEYRTW